MEFGTNARELVLFASKLFKAQYSHSTIQSYISAISFWHKIHQRPDPTDNFLIKKFLSGIKKVAPAKARLHPVSKDILHFLVNNVQRAGLSKYDQILLKAMLSLMYFACLRIGEVAMSKNKAHVLKINQFTFLDSTIKCEEKLEINFKSYKHSKSNIPILAIGKQQENTICPITLFKSYRNITTPSCHFSYVHSWVWYCS